MTRLTDDSCPYYPYKVRKTDILQAIDGLIERFQQPGSRVRRTYKCWGCGGWHYTKRTHDNRRSADPFPRPYRYGVEVDGHRVWQSDDQDRADRQAKKLRGVVVPFVIGHPKGTRG